MSGKEEKCESKGFEFCRSFMGKCCSPAAGEERGGLFNFEKCAKMMEGCCSNKDGKFDFEAFRSEIAKHFKSGDKESAKKEC